MSIVTTTEASLFPAFENLGADELTQLLSASETFVKKLTGRTFEYAQFEEEIDGNGTKYIYLVENPIESIDSVYISDVEYNVSNFVFGEGGRLVYTNCFPKGDQNIVVTYTAGYEEDDMPDDLKQAVLLVAMKMFENISTRKNAAMQSEKMGEHTFTRVNPIQPLTTPKVMDILNSYINFRIY